MNRESENFDFAKFASGGFWEHSQTYYDRRNEDREFINMQLRYWTEALDRFNELNEDNYTVEEGLLIINELGNSILALGSRNYNPSIGEHIPSIPGLYGNKPWDLKSAENLLYEKLLQFNDIYNNLTKHVNMTRIELLKIISYSDISKYMDMAQAIWKWVLKNHFVNIPARQQYHFDHVFPYKWH